MIVNIFFHNSLTFFDLNSFFLFLLQLLNHYKFKKMVFLEHKNENSLSKCLNNSDKPYVLKVGFCEVCQASVRLRGKVKWWVKHEPNYIQRQSCHTWKVCDFDHALTIRLQEHKHTKSKYHQLNKIKFTLTKENLTIITVASRKINNPSSQMHAFLWTSTVSNSNG